jgi:hypothetical protein
MGFWGAFGDCEIAGGVVEKALFEGVRLRARTRQRELEKELEN